MKKLTLRHFVLAGLLGALIAALGFTPLGMVPVPTPAGAATILHIPVIIAALLEGPLFGAMVGFMFGAVSFWRALVAPSNPLAQVMFTDPVTAFLPRILIGVTTYYAFRAAGSELYRRVICGLSGLLMWDLSYRVVFNAGWVRGVYPVYFYFFPVAVVTAYLLFRLLSGEGAPVIAGALAGSLTNTVGVLGLVTIRGILPPAAAGVVAVVHGLPEAAVAVVFSLMLYRALRHRVTWRER